MIEEKVSVAPMLEWTDPHFRMLMRGITRKSVLYTEMLVDETIIHTHPSALDFMVGRAINEDPSVIQLGGHDPHTLAEAAAKCEAYCQGSYAEFNINCGCPSQRVAKRCFGAQLMFQPDLVQEIVKTIQRRVSTPVTIKCRIGVDDLDSYDSLKHFVTQTCVLTGVKKVVLHARKAISGLNTKQNRAVPPLCYNVVHQLAKDFPDIAVVLNGGVQTLEDTEKLLNDAFLYDYDPSNSYNDIHWNVLGKRDFGTSQCDDSLDGSLASSPLRVELPPVHGVMLGRAVYNNPLLLCTADSRFYRQRDPCLSRRQILERYMDYCDQMQGDSTAPTRVVSSSAKKEAKEVKITCSILLNAMRNVINQVKNVNKYRQVLNDVYVEEVRRLGGKDVHANPSARTVIEEAMRVLDPDQLDAPLGDVDFHPHALA